MITKIIPDYLRKELLSTSARGSIADKVTLIDGSIIVHYRRDGTRQVVDLIPQIGTNHSLKDLLHRWAEEDQDVKMTLVIGDL